MVFKSIDLIFFPAKLPKKKNRSIESKITSEVITISDSSVLEENST